MQFRELITILGSRWKTLVTCILLVVGASAAVTALMVPVYQAQARFYFSASTTGNTLSRSDLDTFVELLNSPVLLDPLRQELGGGNQSFTITGAMAETAPIMDITVSSSSPELAAAAANAAGPLLAKTGAEFSPVLSASGMNVKASSLRPADVPTSPVSPNVVTNLALAVLAGLALGIGAVLLRNAMDTRIRQEADLRAISDRPILGLLARIKDPNARVVMDSDPHSLAAEEYRRLRTNLQFVDVTTGGKHSFVVTSASAGEGKTTTAVNLALALADSGSRVLLVDADLRHPSVASVMGLEGSIGLTTVLLGRASLDQATQRWRNSTLSVLAAGAQPPNPSELLGSDATARLFERLLAAYDFVIVDSPPIVPVIDPVLINRLVGGLLLVVSVGATKKRDLAHALRSLATVDADVSGFALNLVDTGNAYYTYGEREGRRSKPKRAAARAIEEAAVPGGDASAVSADADAA